MGNKKIRLGLVGVGNCAASLVEGIVFYKDQETADRVGGLMHYNVGGYEPSDIQVVVGFDVDSKKVGKDVSQAIWEKPNCAYKICDVPFLNAPVLKAPVLDGAPEHLRYYYGKDYFTIDDSQQPVDVAQALIDYKVDVILINLPTGSHDAVRFYVDCAKKAKCGVVNGIPEFIASDPKIAAECKEAGIPVLGDDWKSQIGATIVHRALAKLFEDRGIRIDKTARRVFINGVEKPFTTKEFDLLTFLAENPNHVFTKEELFREIWDMDSIGDIATVTVHIKKIREKIETDTANPQYIETIWGVGYRFKV